MPDVKSRWIGSPWAQGLVLVLATLAVYRPALDGGFVWDDRSMVTENPFVTSLSGLTGIWFSGETHDYFPLTLTSLWFDWHLWGGARPFGFHAANLAYHALGVLLLWRVLLRLRIPGAWLGALLFAIHPVNVASVAWIAERKNTLSLVFYLAAALWYFRFEAGRRPGQLALAIGFFLLALLSKTSTVMLPCVLLLCAWWQRGRIGWRDLRDTAPFFLLSLLFGLLTVWFQHHRAIVDADVPVGDFSSRLITAAWAVAFYGQKVLVPWPLSMLYPHWQIGVSQLGIILLPAGLLLAAFICRRSWGRAVLFGLGYFLLSLFPVLGFFKMYYFRLSPVADHWQYLASIGLIALVAAAVTLWSRRRPVARWIGVALVLVFGGLSWSRSHVLHDERTLWNDVLKKDPDSWTAHSNLTVTCLEEGNIPTALEHGRRLVELKPDYVESHLNYGASLSAAGRKVEAVSAYRQAAAMAPRAPDVVREFALALRQAGELAEAARIYQEVARLKPDAPQSFIDLGAVLYQMNRPTDAAASFRQAVALDPRSADARNNLAGALYLCGDTAAAVEEYREALRIDPQHRDARNNLSGISGMR